jgi:DNA-binding NarL/FixJ family response regulator
VTDQAPIILISDVDDAEHIVEALEQGIRGYIPTNLALTIAAETLRFVRAGGTFIPASALLALPRHYRSPA